MMTKKCCDDLAKPTRPVATISICRVFADRSPAAVANERLNPFVMLLWNDPALGIKWPVSESEAILSAKDKVQPLLSELPPYFHFDPEDPR